MCYFGQKRRRKDFSVGCDSGLFGLLCIPDDLYGKFISLFENPVICAVDQIRIRCISQRKKTDLPVCDFHKAGVQIFDYVFNLCNVNIADFAVGEKGYDSRAVVPDQKSSRMAVIFGIDQLALLCTVHSGFLIRNG